jgi:hypothetical protein
LVRLRDVGDFTLQRIPEKLAIIVNGNGTCSTLELIIMERLTLF